VNFTALALDLLLCCPQSVSAVEPLNFAPGENDPRAFCTTRWSVILRAGHSTEQARGALEKLCRAYWYPLYVFVRRRGYDAHAAQDLTQGFFARLLNDGSLQQVHPTKGKFRSFLLASMKHYLANDWRDSQRQKRGGGVEIVAWDHLHAEERYLHEPQNPGDADANFDRGWARTVVTTALARLEEEMTEDGDGERFALLKGFLQGDAASSSYADKAKAADLSEGAIKSAIFRMRRRYAEFIREEIAQTLDDPREVEAEIRYLISVLAQ
jgi:DNA-directed RNA polymerase specialized sigma24 family protein